MGNPDNSTIPVFSSPSSTGLSIGTEPWSVGLCDCFSDCGTYCKTFWCPCVTFGQIAEIVQKGEISCCVAGRFYVLTMLLFGCGCINSCLVRSDMRNMFKLQGSRYQDCLTHFFCEPLALTQMYRELQHRGFDVSLGWEENVRMKTRGVAAMAPPTKQAGMNR